MKLSTYQNLRVPNFSVQAMCEILKIEELDWQGALLRAQLDPNAITRPGGTIPGQKELAFQIQFVALTEGRVDLWFRAAESYTPVSFGTRGQAMLAAPTLQQYVELVDGTTDVGPAILEVRSLKTSDGTTTGIECTYPEVPDEIIRFCVYRDFYYNIRTLPWLYGGAFPFTKVEFPFEGVSALATEKVRCAVETGSEGLKIWWDPAASNTPLPFGNTFQFETFVKADAQILEALQSTGDWPGTVRQAIRAAPQFNRKLENAASSLGVSTRTLQRRLKFAGSDFGRIRDVTLNNLAAELLSTTDHSVSRIARALGYSDAASFSIAFKRWNGVPPSTFRDAAHYPDYYEE